MEEDTQLLLPTLASADPFSLASLLLEASPPRPPTVAPVAAAAAPVSTEAASPFLPFSHWASNSGSSTPGGGGGDHLSPFPLACQLTPASPLPKAWRPPTAPSPMPPPKAAGTATAAAGRKRGGSTSRRPPLATTPVLQPPPPPPSAPRTRRSTRASKTGTATQAASTPSTVSLATPAAASWVVLPPSSSSSSSSPPIWTNSSSSDSPAPRPPTGGKRLSSILQRKVAVVGHDTSTAGGVGERVLAERLFPPANTRPVCTRNAASASAPSAATQPKPAAKPQPKRKGKQGYLPVEKGRHLFRLLMAHYSTGDWSSTLSDAQADAIAAQAGCTAQQVRKKRENVLSRYCSSTGKLQTSALAVKLALGDDAPALAPVPAPAGAWEVVKEEEAAPAPASPSSPRRAAKRSHDSGVGGGGGGAPWCSPVGLSAPPDAPKKRRGGPPQPKPEPEE